MAKIWPKRTLLAIKVINWILMNSRACKTMLFWLFHPFYNYFLRFELHIQAKMRAWDKSLFESNITTAMQPVMCGCALGIFGILIITNSITWEQCYIRNRATLFEYFNLICSAITVIVTRNYKHSIANNDFLLGLISGEHLWMTTYRKDGFSPVGRYQQPEHTKIKAECRGWSKPNE